MIDINLTTFFARSASEREPNYHVCEGAIRAYAMGLAGSGNTDAAVDLLLRMPEVNVGLQSVHRRMAAMFLYAEKRDREAGAILNSTVSLPRGVALADLRAVLAEQPAGNRTFDDHGLRAFGISPQDTTGLQELMQWYADMNYAETALRFAYRVQALVPGDPRADAVRRKMVALLETRKRLPPGAWQIR